MSNRVNKTIVVCHTSLKYMLRIKGLFSWSLSHRYHPIQQGSTYCFTIKYKLKNYLHTYVGTGESECGLAGSTAVATIIISSHVLCRWSQSCPCNFLPGRGLTSVVPCLVCQTRQPGRLILCQPVALLLSLSIIRHYYVSHLYDCQIDISWMGSFHWKTNRPEVSIS